MPKHFVVLHNLPNDPNDPTGPTIKDVNMAKPYVFPIGSLVEWPNGVRLFVVSHCRDCDGTPMYMLCYNPEELTPTINGWTNREWVGPFGTSCDDWKLISGPKEKHADWC